MPQRPFVESQRLARREMNSFRNGFNSNRGSSGATELDRLARGLLIALLALLLAAPWPLQAAETATGSTKFIPTFLVYYGRGPALVASDAPKLAKFDLIDIARFRYDNIGPNTWAAIKSINPGVQIYLYEMGPETPSYLDGTPQLYLNGLGRYDVSRGHFMGSLNGNHPELYLLDSSGNRVYSTVFSNVGANQYWHLMDFGTVAYQSYWLTAVKADIVDQPWVADGVFVDNCLALAGGYSGIPSMYPSNAAWSGAMNSFAEAITAGMHGYGQKLWCNRGETGMADGSAAWLALDGSASPPDVLLEPGVFAVASGSGDVRFYDESQWKRQVDTIGAIRNSRVAMMSHTKLAEGETGTDNWGKPVNYWQTLWYSLGSFLLSKNDELGNAYFMFNGGSGYDRIWWYDEYDNIDLGKAIGPYRVATIGSANVYWREFERGYVYVNPTPSDVASVILSQASRQLTRDNLISPPDAIPSVNSIALNSHNAAILLKVNAAPPPTPDTAAVSVRSGAVSAATPALVPAPYSGTPIAVPGSFEAENFDLGGEGVAYHDKTPGNQGGRYRITEDVDIVMSYDALGGGYVVNNFETGEWLAYTINVAASALYDIEIRASSAFANSAFHVEIDGQDVTGLIIVPNTGGWNAFQWVGKQAVPIATGKHVLKIFADQQYFNLNSIRVTATASTPYTGTPIAVPGSFEAENFDLGGEGVAYHDKTPGNQGGLYRITEDVDIVVSYDALGGGYVVNNFETGEWLAYTINVAASALYDIEIRASSAFANSAFHVEIDGQDVTGLIIVPNTGGWNAFQWVGKQGVPIATGKHVLKIFADQQYFNLNSIRVMSGADTQAPSVPENLHAIVVSSSQIDLAWSAATDNIGVTGYRVYRDGTLVASPTSTSVSIAGLSASTLYAFTVSALDAAGNASAQSAPLSATTPAPPDTTVPSTPTDLIGVAVSSSQINLSWTAATDNVGVTGYNVYRGGMQIATLGVVTTFQNTGLTASTNYSYTVRAFDAAGNVSGQSMAASAATQAPGTSGTVPTPYTGTPVAVPGSFEAENFDLGGEGVAYHDKTPGNQGGLYRITEDVDIVMSY